MNTLKVLPFLDTCMLCDLGDPREYEEFHPPTDKQLSNLEKHVRARFYLDYVHNLNFGPGVKK